MQQQYAKGDALKEVVRGLLVYFLTRYSRVVAIEHRPDGVGKDRKA
jgi:hypothetical protein